MIGSRSMFAVLTVLLLTPAVAADNFRPIMLFDEALREVWPAGMSPTGSGFPVAPGLVMTAAHVVAGCRVMWVRSPSTGRAAATILGIDTRIDVALLSVAAMRGSKWSSPATARAGQPLSLRGFPRRKGKVSDVPSDIEAIGLGLVEEEGAGFVLEMEGHGPEGISGGPALDPDGRVVGMVVARRDGSPEHILAIPAGRLQTFLAYMGLEWGAAEAAGEATTGSEETGGSPWPVPRPRPKAPGGASDVVQVGCSR